MLSDISVDSTDSVSITLTQPTFSVTGSAGVSVMAYIGLNGTIAQTENLFQGISEMLLTYLHHASHSADWLRAEITG